MLFSPYMHTMDNIPPAAAKDPAIISDLIVSSHHIPGTLFSLLQIICNVHVASIHSKFPQHFIIALTNNWNLSFICTVRELAICLMVTLVTGMLINCGSGTLPLHKISYAGAMTKSWMKSAFFKVIVKVFSTELIVVVKEPNVMLLAFRFWFQGCWSWIPVQIARHDSKSRYANSQLPPADSNIHIFFCYCFFYCVCVPPPTSFLSEAVD